MQELQRSREGYKFIPFLFRKYEELPENWEVMKLIDLCKNKPQYGAPVSAIARVDGLPRYIRITDLNDDGSLRKDEQVSITDEQANSYILSEGEIVFARTGATVGKTYAYKKEDGKCAFAGYLIRFIPDENKLDTKFLLHYTHSYNYWRWLKSIFTEGVQPNVNAEQYSRMLIIKPPIKEQQKIASILSKVDELIQKTDQVIEQTQRLKKGLMQKLFTKGIGHNKFKKVRMGFRYMIEEYPEEWEISKLSEFCKVERGKFTHRPRDDPDYYDGDYPFIQTGDIERSNGYIQSFSQTLNENGLSVSKLFSGEIIVITIAATIGSVAITTFPVCFPDSIVGISTSKMNLRFLFYYLKTRKRFLEISATISAQPNINLETLKPLLIPVPPLEEQDKIVYSLSTIDDKIQTQINIKSRLEYLKRGLMQKLLTGKIRVKV